MEEARFGLLIYDIYVAAALTFLGSLLGLSLV